MASDPLTTKYEIHAQIEADGVIEKPDVVGAIFGQTEGLLGTELDLRDLQKSGRMGRIEVAVGTKKGKTDGSITIPSSLDQVETAILASALESIDRIGPCRARIKVDRVEDVRGTKREKIVERAKQILGMILKQSKVAGGTLADEVRKSMHTEELIHLGSERCPAGPGVKASDNIIVVEGRNDVLNLLSCGLNNAIGVEGTNIPQTIIDMTQEKTSVAFVDGDRGGELILKELLQVAEIDYVARAPPGREVEELSIKQITKALQNKESVEQYNEAYGIDGDGGSRKGASRSSKFPAKKGQGKGRSDRRTENKGNGQRTVKTKKAAPPKKLSPEQQRYKDMLDGLERTAILLDGDGESLEEIPVRDLPEQIPKHAKISAVIFDGVITQKMCDIAIENSIITLVGVKRHNLVKEPKEITIYTREDLT